MKHPIPPLLLSLVITASLNAQFGTESANAVSRDVVVKPIESNDVLSNPGIGFTTLQRFNGDTLNEGDGWTEGYPIQYQEFDGNLANENHPDTTIAYFRVNWRFLETENDVYNWEMIDKALRTARERGQTLALRISPYEGEADKNVPEWYRELTGDQGVPENRKWEVDPEHPEYVNQLGSMIRELGQRYDGHPDLEFVDISVIGWWGEGDGGHLIKDSTRIQLIRAYLDNFKKTQLILQPLNGDAPDPSIWVRGLPIAASWQDGTNNGTGPHMRYLGIRFDCLGDMGFWSEQRGDDWNHMEDVYPQDIIKSGMADAWKKAPVALEICGTFTTWKEEHGYDDSTVRYIFSQALKWHVSSFNAKSSPVPEEWQPLVDEWLKKMGYRFVLRKFTYPKSVTTNGKLAFTSWWENVGVAPSYRNFPVALRLRNQNFTVVLQTDCYITQWLPGDRLLNDAVFIPMEMPAGTYDLDIAMVDPSSNKPAIDLAIEGKRGDGWYSMGTIDVMQPSLQ